MRTKEELLEFLNRVVGEEYVTVEGNGDDGEKVNILPYNYEITSGGFSENINGFITFKGEHLDAFNHSTREMVKVLVDCMNHAYSASIKDCLAGDPDILSQYKMSRFKFQ
jgi:hypothetical protein